MTDVEQSSPTPIPVIPRLTRDLPEEEVTFIKTVLAGCSTIYPRHKTALAIGDGGSVPAMTGMGEWALRLGDSGRVAAMTDMGKGAPKGRFVIIDLFAFSKEGVLPMAKESKNSLLLSYTCHPALDAGSPLQERERSYSFL